MSTTVQITPDIAARYDELARASGRSLDQIVEEVLRAYLAEEAEDRARIEASIAAGARGEFATAEEMDALFADYAGSDRAGRLAALDQEMRDAYCLPSCD